ncbi:hypothetical protein ACHAXA_002046 [Cyclostephanos tholiformis]|uniref:Peptidase S1 domain-containing protein n=1 Tax=Cyclostephanos tholiformis TaxID=382380 RepID=A0ABD3SSG8_9STRA
MEGVKATVMTAPRSRDRLAASIPRAALLTRTIGCCCCLVGIVPSPPPPHAVAAAATSMDVVASVPSSSSSSSSLERRRSNDDNNNLLSSRTRTSSSGGGATTGWRRSGGRRLYETMVAHQKTSGGGGGGGGGEGGGGGVLDPRYDGGDGTYNDHGDGHDVGGRTYPISAASDLSTYARAGVVGDATSSSTLRYPYMASLQLEGHDPTSSAYPGDGDDGGGGGIIRAYDAHVCSGALVAPDLVLTSAHCAHYAPPGTDEWVQAFNGIEIGRVRLDDDDEYGEMTTVEPYIIEDASSPYYENLIPDELILHPNFDASTYEHDVMLIKIFGKSRFPPLRIATDATTIDLAYATALGWGADSATSDVKFSNELRSATLEFMTNDECKNIEVEVRDPDTGATSTVALRGNVYDDMMCGTTPSTHGSSRRICYGDAGGPVILEGEGYEDDSVYGIISWGYGCVNRDYPTVATRLSDHYDWIRDTLCQKSTDPPAMYDCPTRDGMSVASGGGETQTVTLKLNLDAMAVETGFVIELRDSRVVIAQRQTGYYKARGNEVVHETMDLPSDQCYRLILLDSYGDGFCCDMGGGNAILFLGTDVGHTTGHRLVEVNGNFEFDKSGEFCLMGEGSSNQQTSDVTQAGSGVVLSSSPPTSASTSDSDTMVPSPSPTSEEGAYPDDQVASTSSWNGPELSPDFDYCTLFCSTSPGVMCGKYQCSLTSNAIATSDTQGQETSNPQDTDDEVGVDQGVYLTSNEYYTPSSEHYISVKFQFDDNPEEISWVLFDLVEQETKVFVDYGAYPKEEYANKLLTIPVTMDGPEMGEKHYVFTVYDENSDGLCCDRGEGYYKVYLGDVEDDHELLGDSAFNFSSSYYFTLFKTEDETADSVNQNTTAGFFAENATVSTAESNETASTLSPTLMPSEEPTAQPTDPPTRSPTRSPTWRPTHSPSTGRPTDPWEIRRPEDAAALGARWSMPSKTSPGTFNDIGGDQRKYNLNANRAMISAAANDFSTRMSVAGSAVLVCWLLS